MNLGLMLGDPKPGQLTWRWSHKDRRPIRVRYMGRNRTWRRWQNEVTGATWNENGLGAWYDNPVNCAWGQLERLSFRPGSRRTIEAQADDVFSVACEYVRQFSAQFNKPCGEVWEKGLKPEVTP